MKTASETAKELINKNPHLFKDDSETLYTIGTALIDFGEQMANYVISKLRDSEIKTELQSLSKIKP